VCRRERPKERVSLGIEGLLSGYVTTALRSVHVDKMYIGGPEFEIVTDMILPSTCSKSVTAAMRSGERTQPTPPCSVSSAC
jgi:hypothetical protein